MIKKKSRLIKYVIQFLLLPVLAFSQSHKNGFESKFNKVLSSSFFTSSLIGIEVYDLTDNKILFSKDEKLLLRPASNMKLLTSAAALLYLPDDYSFSTDFYLDGRQVDSVFYGDLIIKGGFDPEYKYEALDTVVTSIKQLGIKQIQGRILSDISETDSLYWGKGWMWDDNPSEFQPYISSLNINHNTVDVIYSPGKIGELANVTTFPPSGYYSMENSLITTKEDTSDIKITRDWLEGGTNKIIAEGDISYRRRIDTNKVNILHPELYFATLLKEKMLSDSILMSVKIDTGTVTDSSQLFFTQHTAMQKVLHEMNKDSKNLNAECFIRALAKEYSKQPYSTEKGLKLVDSLVVRLEHDSDDYVFADGSGLSFYNLVSAELITDILKYLYQEYPEKYTMLANSLPVAGVDGTLEHRMRSAPTYKKVRAKTGTISGVSSLSGYLTTNKNHVLAFSILIQNYSGKASYARRFQDNICKLLIESY